MKHKVVVVGAGYFGQRHIKMLSQMDDVKIVGIVDKDINRAVEVSKEFGFEYSDNFKDFLDKAEVFFIVTPTKTHFEIAIELIEKKKDIFIEKPLTESPEEASILLDRARKRGIIFQVGLIERFNPVLETLIENLNNPIFINANRLSPFLGRATDTDVTFDLMIHDIDLVLMISKRMGNPHLRELRAFKKSFVTSKIDFANVMIEVLINSKSLVVNLTASRVSCDFQRIYYVINKDFAIHADLINKKIIKIDKKGKINDIPVRNKDSQPLYNEIREFLNAVKERKPSLKSPNSEEIIEVIRIINQINGDRNDEAIY